MIEVKQSFPWILPEVYSYKYSHSTSGSNKKNYRLILPSGTDYSRLLTDADQIYGYFGFAGLLGLEVTEVEEKNRNQT